MLNAEPCRTKASPASYAVSALGIEAAERLQPDLIVLDLNLPTVNGLEACRQITKASPHIRVILLMADRDSAIMRAALAAGACAFIEKQAIADDLLPAIKRACADGQA
jgi:DNA-binding NarL/FixJ family response regulator